MCVCKPILVKDFCPRFTLDLALDFVLGLGEAFQKVGENNAQLRFRPPPREAHASRLNQNLKIRTSKQLDRNMLLLVFLSKFLENKKCKLKLCEISLSY